MEIYSVGSPFPNDAYRGDWDAAAVLHLVDDIMNVLLLINRPTIKEMEMFNHANLKYGLLEEEKVPYITLEFEKMNFYASFNCNNLHPANAKRFLNSESNALSMILIDSGSYIVEGIRVIGAENDFMQSLRSVLKEQQEKYSDRYQVDEKIRRFQNRYTPNQILSRAKKYSLRK